MKARVELYDRRDSRLLGRVESELRSYPDGSLRNPEPVTFPDIPDAVWPNYLSVVVVTDLGFLSAPQEFVLPMPDLGEGPWSPIEQYSTVTVGRESIHMVLEWEEE